MDPDDEDVREGELLAGTTIVTKADGDNNQQDYDDDDIVAFAGTTTLTESRGDHESDPDEDDIRDFQDPVQYPDFGRCCIGLRK
jgi:hypothetical protein